MELSGDLSDFALTDILQILGLSRKTGTLWLKNGDVEGSVIIEDGRITYASLTPGHSFEDCLLRRGLLSEQVLRRLREIGRRNQGFWTLETLIIESGLMGREKLEGEARQHIQDTVACLLGVERGSFGMALNQAAPIRSFEEIRLCDGLEISKVLLEAAKGKDELGRKNGHRDRLPRISNKAPESDNIRELYPLPDISQGTGLKQRGDEGSAGVHRNDGDDSEELRVRLGSDGGGWEASFCSILSELRNCSCEVEVSLLIMRYVSQIASRGVLFMIRGSDIYGLGQFGLEQVEFDRTADEIIRDIKIPLDGDSVIGEAVRTGRAYVGALTQGFWNMELLDRIGGAGYGLEVLALPLMCLDRIAFVVYGDNYPGTSKLKGIEELVVLGSQASILLEKLALEQRITDLELIER
jgi:hypothetical protein